jgi:2-dehydro-3-deoxyphosphogluconate aldolase/(4S)-4-hydroxy-2-oxoglutarate aldolase
MSHVGADEVIARFRQLRIVPVIVIEDAAHALPLADALTAGGLPCAEITFRTGAAPDALRRIAAEREDVLVGAGTVLTPQQADEARAAGARYVVSPGFNPRVVDHCRARGIPVFPGVCTPTEIEAALEHGLSVLKFFPAEPMGGITLLRAAAAPFGSAVEFIPTGGINAENVSGYLAFERVVACGGSWMASAEWISGRQFGRVTAAAEAAVRLVRSSHAGAS